MQVKSFIMGAVLVAGLLAGCGGMEGDAEPGSALTGGERTEAGESQVQQASTCSDACDARLDNCLRSGMVHMTVCFERHENCMMYCPVEDAR